VKTPLRKGIHIILPLLLGLALAQPCWAEEGDDTVVLETVKVTAQKREENVQEVPGSVSVLSGMDLEEARVMDLSRLHEISPNFYYGTTGQGTYTYLGMRGRINNSVDVDPTVTIFVDGVPYDDFYSMDGAMLFDVERVEVLRGPQSTLYGMNSIGGVVNIITRQPGDDPHASVGTEISGGPDRDMSTLVRGAVSGPVVDGVLSMGVAAVRKETRAASSGTTTTTTTPTTAAGPRAASARSGPRWRNSPPGPA